MNFLRAMMLTLLVSGLAAAQCFQLHTESTAGYVEPGEEFVFYLLVENLQEQADSININMIPDVPDGWSASICTEAGCLLPWLTYTQIWVETDVMDTVSVDFFTGAEANEGTMTLEFWPNGCPDEMESITFYLQTFEESVTEVIPGDIELLQAYPNPFNPSTRFSWSQRISGPVTLDVLNLMGEIVAQPLVNSWHRAGVHQLSWLADDQPAGVYLLRLRVHDDVRATRVTLLK